MSPTTNMVPTGLPSRPSRPISAARSTTARKRFQGNLGIELAQLLGAEAFQVLAQVDDAEAVDVFRLALLGLDAVVKCHHVCSRLELFIGHCLEQSQAHAFLGRGWAGIDVEDGQAVLLLESFREVAVLGRHQEAAAPQMVQDRVPVKIGFGEKQHGVGRHFLDQLAGRLEQYDRLMWQRHCLLSALNDWPLHRVLIPMPCVMVTIAANSGNQRSSQICLIAEMARPPFYTRLALLAYRKGK